MDTFGLMIKIKRQLYETAQCSNFINDFSPNTISSYKEYNNSNRFITDVENSIYSDSRQLVQFLVNEKCMCTKCNVMLEN